MAKKIPLDEFIPNNIDSLNGMQSFINRDVFNEDDVAALSFFKENGYCVVRGLVTESELQRMRSQYVSIVRKQYEVVKTRIGDVGVTFEEFAANISQFRDLFLRDIDGETNVFAELIRSTRTNSMGSMASRAMAAIDPRGKWHGVKLLHDHAITKPAGQHNSKKIPLHQDRMFWPVDSPACSTWTPLTDVDLDGGCLELIMLQTKPHINVKTMPAVDFMASETDSGLKSILNEDHHPVRHLVPMKAGDTLVFSSNTWHRSSRSVLESKDRVAYIQTWTHPNAKWRPDLVPWHPVNEHMSQAGHVIGDLMLGDRHPTVGMGWLTAPAEDSSSHEQSIYFRHECSIGIATKQRGSDISMYDASDVVSTQIHNIIALSGGVLIYNNAEHAVNVVNNLMQPGRFAELVDLTENMMMCESALAPARELVETFLVESGCTTAGELLHWALKRIMIAAAAYQSDRSRNVFNSAYRAWWEMAGSTWNQHFLTGKFRIEYRLCKTDVMKFLDRIEVSLMQHNFQTEAGQLGLLNAMIRGCMSSIPFQNITMLTRIKSSAVDHDVRCPPSLGEVIDDMVSGIGGLCVVRTPFLYLLLKYLCFDNLRFIAGTMCFNEGEELLNAHTALLVSVANIDYWVDIGNGWPYMSAIPLESNGEYVIDHSFMKTRLKKKRKHNCDVYVVEHLLSTSEDWVENYYFRSSSVSFSAAFDASMTRHYDSKYNFGHFLKHLRFNIWEEDSGVMLRDQDFVRCTASELSTTKLDFSNYASVDQFEYLLQGYGIYAEKELVADLRNAWFRCQKSIGRVYEAEKVSVTGGFFDNSPNGYIGVVTVWRFCGATSEVFGLTYKTIKEFVPEAFPVVNKGFAGGSWFNKDLYVCWPNRVAILFPASNWSVSSYIDDPGFNDLHHVHACLSGVWVANTGIDSVDKFDSAGRLVSRNAVSSRSFPEHDVRFQSEHDLRRGQDKEHVNFVYVVEDPQNEINSVSATLLQSKRVVRFGTSGELITTVHLRATWPPHEGFVEPSSRDSEQLIWNSTVDGHVVASDPATGAVRHSWDISLYPDCIRGWTRGLCVLRDGFLVGSTIIRGENSESWIEQHGNKWNFETSQSKTGVSFIPFKSSNAGASMCTKSVEFLSCRNGKVFSLLRVPEGVVI